MKFKKHPAVWTAPDECRFFGYETIDAADYIKWENFAKESIAALFYQDASVLTHMITSLM